MYSECGAVDMDRDRQHCQTNGARQAERTLFCQYPSSPQMSRGTLAFNNLVALSRAIEVMGSIRSSPSTSLRPAEVCLSRLNCWTSSRCARQAFWKGDDALDRFALKDQTNWLLRTDIAKWRIQVESFVEPTYR